MNTIEFKLTKIKYGIDEVESDAVDIFVNGKNFLKEIQAYEKYHNINGGHVPITPYEIHQSLAEDYLTESVPVFGCGCGFVDCCPVYISVNVDDNFVTWDNFQFPDEMFKIKDRPRQKFRKRTFYKAQYFSKNSNENVGFKDKPYKKFRKLTFYKAQYFSEVEKLKHWLFDDAQPLNTTALTAVISH